MAGYYLTSGDPPVLKSNIHHIIPYSNDYYQQIPERYDSAMDRTAQYVSGLGEDHVDPYSRNHHHRHHHHHQHQHQHQHQHHEHHQSPRSIPPLSIRRHTAGSTDPAIQTLPNPPQTSLSAPSNLHITVRRNAIPVEQNLIQPVYYPVPVYVNSPVHVPVYVNSPVPPPFRNNQSIPAKIKQAPLKKLLAPKGPAQPYPESQPIKQWVRPLSPIDSPRESPIPIITSPRKSPIPIITSPVPSNSSDRYETESFHLPTPRQRQPLRKVPPQFDPQTHPGDKVVIEEYDDYDEYFQSPKKSLAEQRKTEYLPTVGKTTRELENQKMEKTRQEYFVESPTPQTVTFRT